MFLEEPTGLVSGLAKPSASFIMTQTLLVFVNLLCQSLSSMCVCLSMCV